MTFGSAASLPRLAPAMPPPIFRFRRPVLLAAPMAAPPAEAQSEGAPPGGAPQVLAATDPPGGRILVVEPQAIIALDLQRILREAGYRVVGPATSVAATRRLLQRERIDCAVLDLESDVEDFSTVAGLLARAGVPFVVLGSGRRLAPGLLANRPIVEKPYMPGDVLMAVRNAISGEGGVVPSVAFTVEGKAPPWREILPLSTGNSLEGHSAATRNGSGEMPTAPGKLHG